MDMATHDTVVKARRSNNCLDTSRLQAAAGDAFLPDALTSIRALLARNKPSLGAA
jgi:hypothetical protein